MEESQEPPPNGNKKPSLLLPMLLWPLVGVPAYWSFLWVLSNLLPQRSALDFSWEIDSLMLSAALCFIIGAILGFRFARRTTDDRFPLAEPIVCGVGAGLLSLVYNIGGCALAFSFIG